MNSGYQNRTFTAVVIGKKLIISIFAAVMAVVAAVSLWFIAVNIMHAAQAEFHIYMFKGAMPIAAATDGVDIAGDIKRLVHDITGLDVTNHAGNFDILPYFGAVDGKKNIQPVSASLPQETVRNTEAPLPQPVSEQTNADSNLKIKNETKYNIDTSALLGAGTNFNMAVDGPQILVVHTHGTESYTQSPNYRYSDTDSARCNDIRYNVVRVGDELTAELEKRGYRVIHDKSLNDYPSYNNSYNKTLGVIESYLAQYPSIQCVFDVHRDAVEKDGTKVKFTADINGEKVSQVMLVCGSDGLGLENPDWQQNLSFALKIQNYLNCTYPGLMRPVNLRNERFNLHKTRGSLILEFGTHGNTLDEALAAVKYVAEGIDGVLKQGMQNAGT